MEIVSSGQSHINSTVSYALNLGKEDYHHEIRLLCMKYIKNEEVFFQDYVTENIDRYIN